jgi:hypothetical protein
MHAKWSKWEEVEAEVRLGKRLRHCRHFDGIVSCEREGDYALVKYAGTKQAPEPDAKSVLELLLDVKAAGWVLGDVSRDAFSGAKLRRATRAVEVRRTYHEGWDFKEGDPPERLELSRGGDYLEGMKNWATWDLYAVSAWLDHPLSAQCRSLNRPSVEECLAALAAAS